MRSFFKSQKGFTLIELLVVITIIGILSSVVLVSFQSVNKKARDAKRISELKQFSTVLELFYSIHGHYPRDGASGTYAGCWKAKSNWIPDGSGSVDASYNWSNEYISKQPQDPTDICCWPWGNGSCGSAGQPGTYEYWASSNGKTYLLAARLEDINNPNRAEITGVIDPRDGQLYSDNGPLGKYVFVITATH
jgi:prepilin-type N-terminal cleavage/methylation domain-containing protein